MRKAVTYIFLISCSVVGGACGILPIIIFILFAPTGLRDWVLAWPVGPLRILQIAIFLIFGIIGATAYYVVGSRVLASLGLWDLNVGSGSGG